MIHVAATSFLNPLPSGVVSVQSSNAFLMSSDSSHSLKDQGIYELLLEFGNEAFHHPVYRIRKLPAAILIAHDSPQREEPELNSKQDGYLCQP